jgi:phosphonate transport system substrate-binding protein
MNTLVPQAHSGGCRGEGAKGRAAPLRFLTFLAPNLFGFYQFITRYLEEKTGHPTALSVGSSYEELVDQADVAFVCGLPYVELARRGEESPVEPLAAPVLQGERYAGKPVYYSDVIVRRDSPFGSFADLRGCSWAYNEPHSQSGYGITRYQLARAGQTGGYFGRVVEAGWHERAVGMVCSGEVDAAAIDSHVLAVALRDRPELGCRLRVIDSLGPSTIQPVVAARRLPERVKADLRSALLGMGRDPAARAPLTRALVEGFTPVTDSTYDDIRRMLAVVETAGFLHLR